MKIRILIIAVLSLALSHLGFGQDRESMALYAENINPEKYVQMYPNPATDFIAVKLLEPHAKSVQLALHSVIGNVLNVDREQVDDFEVRLRVRDLPSGYYFLSIKDEESGLRTTYKFLKR